MHLYFTRHGQSQANADGIVAGQSIDSALTETGQSEAHQAADWLIQNKVKIDVIISSPARRARATAVIIAHDIDFHPADIVYMHGLSERNCGDYEGGPDDAYEEAPESVAVKEHGVESLDDLHTRVKHAFDEIKQKYPSKTMLVVSHNGTGKMLRIVAEARDASEMDKSISLPHANITKLI